MLSKARCDLSSLCYEWTKAIMLQEAGIAVKRPYYLKKRGVFWYYRLIKIRSGPFRSRSLLQQNEIPPGKWNSLTTSIPISSEFAKFYAPNNSAIVTHKILSKKGLDSSTKYVMI